ncbi:type II toxin-antitoxin system VapC family toxin [Roseomonas sp. OT10]|uniref:type II toxin-antitoxin system VapC family toxin n=1 Tax=Roseomonas cutis TaxID=2897332 RepID=UPI001E4698B2|nr:type II toxin-antitoxin system VapC family toxin [Roseomonas sp. OT10]UFN48818.1 type II toxin-antitoxin system VapC family toxin [Roseomonas sp. OT10]
MILDTSALVAILRREAEGARFSTRLAEAARPALSAVTLFETAMVVESRGGPAAGQGLDSLLAEVAVEVVPVTAETARRARDAWRTFGKGRHPAALNVGDCFAYALAQERGEPLLYKGEDFARTDVKPAL